MSAFSSLPVSTYLDSFYCSSRSSTPKWKEEEESSRSSDSIPSLLSVLFSSLRVSKVLSFLLQWIRILFCLISKSESVRCLVLCNFLRPHGPTRLLCPWDSWGKNTGVGRHSLLQGIFPTQGLNLGLLHCRQIFCHLSHQGSPETSSLLLRVI